MDEISKKEEEIAKQEVLLKKIDAILEEIDVILPPNWTKNQVATVFSAYLEFSK